MAHPLELAAIAAYEAFAQSLVSDSEVPAPWAALPAEVRADWRAVADAVLMVSSLQAFPRCPTPCDDDCEQPCHEVHDVPSHRDHNPEVCVGTIVAAAAAAERERIACWLEVNAAKSERHEPPCGPHEACHASMWRDIAAMVRGGVEVEMLTATPREEAAGGQ